MKLIFKGWGRGRPPGAPVARRHCTTMLLRHCCWCGRGFRNAPRGRGFLFENGMPCSRVSSVEANWLNWTVTVRTTDSWQIMTTVIIINDERWMNEWMNDLAMKSMSHSVRWQLTNHNASFCLCLSLRPSVRLSVCWPLSLSLFVCVTFSHWYNDRPTHR